MGPVVQIVGALLVLAGFALAQWGLLDGIRCATCC